MKGLFSEDQGGMAYRLKYLRTG